VTKAISFFLKHVAIFLQLAYASGQCNDTDRLEMTLPGAGAGAALVNEMTEAKAKMIA
jgi:hypothetical protein